MFEVRIHGRGGQGVVCGAQMLSVAAFLQGRHAQAFPSFGFERTAAPVVAYCRIDDREIRLREPVLEPDALIVQDPSLLQQVELFSGVRAGAFIAVNSEHDVEDLGFGELMRVLRSERICTVPASRIARKHVVRDVPNAALLGAFAALCGEIRIESIVAAIRERFPGALGQRNAAAAHEGFAAVKRQREEAPHA